MSKIIESSIDLAENIEDIIKEVDSFEPVVALRLNLAKFMENLSFNEKYLKKVQVYKRNKKEIDKNNKLIGLLRAIKRKG